MNAREAQRLLEGAAELGGEPKAKAPGKGEWLAGFRAGGGLGSLAFRPALEAKLKPFSSAPFREPALRKALEDFHALCPIRAMEVRAGGWALVLEPGTTWPSFLRCDVAAGFASAAALNLLLRDRPLVELCFDGESLWAWVS